MPCKSALRECDDGEVRVNEARGLRRIPPAGEKKASPKPGQRDRSWDERSQYRTRQAQPILGK